MAPLTPIVPAYTAKRLEINNARNTSEDIKRKARILRYREKHVLFSDHVQVGAPLD